MDIKFEEIIERANARKDKLITISKHLEDLANQIELLDESLGYFEELGQMVAALDQEGKSMLPGNVASLAIQVRGNCSYLRQCAFAGTDKPLLVLAEKVLK